MLCSAGITVGPYGKFTQVGGINIVTNILWITGAYPNRPKNDFWIASSRGYSLANGGLVAGSMALYGWAATFVQESGNTKILETLQLNPFPVSEYPGNIFLKRGTLTCSDVTYGAGGADILQSGGTFIVTNLLSFGGSYRSFSGIGTTYTEYSFTGGALYASNIQMNAEWIIGSTTNSGRVTNPGYFKLAGVLTVGDATEQLGRFILASNSIINLGDGQAKLSFASSSGESWNSEAILTVTNWNGSSTGGGGDQLKFGSKSSGLTSGQVSQIRFIDPSGASLARILITGEVVPLERPTLSRAQVGNNLVLSWTGNLSLQTSTNVTGPYLDLPGATSPYTNDMTASPERYFRLRQ